MSARNPPKDSPHAVRLPDLTRPDASAPAGAAAPDGGAEDFRANSFTFLRLILALSVVYSHSFAIAGRGGDFLSLFSLNQTSIGSLAVTCFFIISGFLITGSVQRLPLWRFVVNRAARILPGFWAMLLVSVFVMAPAIVLWKSPIALSYFGALHVEPLPALSYLWKNALLTIHQSEMSLVFDGNPRIQAVNGSLWSLAPEAFTYMLLALLAACGGMRNRMPTVVLAASAYGFHLLALVNPAAVVPLAHFAANFGLPNLQFTEFRSLYVAFIAGMVLFQFQHGLARRGFFFVLGVLLLLTGLAFHFYHFVWPLVLPYLLFFLAYRLPFQNVERWGDFSFGIYIYAFPIQQCLAIPGFLDLQLGPFILLSMGLSVAAGMASWRWIEAPVLRRARAIGRA